MPSDTIFPRSRVTIVGVLNLTPDSFSDGGRFVAAGDSPVDAPLAVAAGQALVAAGAHVLDVGGESTRPGALEIDASDEIERTRGVIEALAKQVDVPLSIDTRKSEVARAALEAGARVVNDISGLRSDPAIAELAAEHGAHLIVGHMRGTPATMQRAPRYDDVLAEVARELEAALALADRAGVARNRLVADPGIGFGKRLEDNLSLIANGGWLRSRLGVPLLVGPSRKSFLGELTGDPVESRDAATAACCAVASFAGFDAVRVHDAAGAQRAVAVGLALRDARRPPVEATR